LVNIILVSPVNKIDLDFPLILFDKSFMQRRKSKGPKIDYCETPGFKNPQSENVL